MTSFFWIAETANLITTVAALAALLVVLWLGPRQWTNLSFATFLLAIILWMLPSLVLRLLVNLPQLGGPWQLLIKLIALGFALIGVTLFWFVESFYPLPRRWRWAPNLLALGVYGLFLILLVQGEIITDPRLGEDGGLNFTITPIGNALSAFHYVYDALALGILIRHASWRERWHLMAGALIVVATSVAALISPAISVQTYTIAVGLLFMAYEVVKQQLFNPLLTMNQRLEREVAQRTAELKTSLVAQERVQSELAIAREIQRSLLPRRTPSHPAILLASHSQPAQEVGGDFYAFHQWADGRLAIAVGDVSGKGVPAALLMALALQTFDLLIDQYPDQGDFLTALNTALTPRMAESGQNTAFLSLVIDPGGQTVALSNAGLIAPFLWRQGVVAEIASYGLPVGATSRARYAELRVNLRPGDRILLASDGLVEAMNPAHEMWGFERLETAFAACGGASPAEIIAALLSSVEAFTAGAAQHDDMTVVVLEVVAGEKLGAA